MNEFALQLPGKIQALACWQDLTFAAVENDIIECTRLRRSGWLHIVSFAQSCALKEGVVAAQVSHVDKSDNGCFSCCRSGLYSQHSGDILQLLVLGKFLLSLGQDGKLLVWQIGKFDEPEASPILLSCPQSLCSLISVLGAVRAEGLLWRLSPQLVSVERLFPSA